jgi:hypothetical protein
MDTNEIIAAINAEIQWLTQPQWQDPLLILMAAVSSNGGNVQRALTQSRKEIAIDVARR